MIFFFFIKVLDSLNLKGSFSLKAKGKVNNFQVSDLLLKTNAFDYDGKASFSNLFTTTPQIEISIDNLSSSYKNIRFFIPQNLNKNYVSLLQNLENFSVRGKAILSNKKYHLAFIINSKKIGLDLNLNRISKIKWDFGGTIESKNFNIDKILGQKLLGKTKGKINFSGTYQKNSPIFFKANSLLNYIDIKNKRIKNIALNIDGNIENFNVYGNINDANLQAKILANYKNNNTIPEFILNINVLKSNLKNLGIMNQDATILTNINGTIKGKEINKIEADISFKNIEYKKNDIKNSFTNFQIKTFYINGTRVITTNF